MGIKHWVTTDADNDDADLANNVDWREGQAPSTVNNTGRAMMTQVRTQWENAQWFDYNDTPVRKTATTFSLSGTHTATYHIGRRLRFTDGGSTKHGVITAQTFSGGTEVTVSLSTGTLSTSLSAVAVAILSAVDVSLPNSSVARAALGLGTGDSPQFTGIELGAATDTTLTRASGGDINIEGNIAYRAGGTDVPVTDGGTGVSTLTDGGVLLGSGTSAITATAVLADGEMIVGDGSTDPALESGDTLRTSIMGAIGPDLNTLGAASSDGEVIVATGAGVFAYESGATLRTSLGLANHDSIVVSAAGEATNSEQPAFLAQPTASLTNVTGNNTAYTVVFATEVFDQNADFDGTSTFTAPVTGKYQLSVSIQVTSVNAASKIEVQLVTSNRTYRSRFDEAGSTAAGTYHALVIAVTADMDASDTATVVLTVNGMGSDISDIFIGASVDTFFSGYLVA